MKRLKNIALVSGSLLLLIFIITLVSFSINSTHKVKKIFFFPSDITSKLEGEPRYITNRGTKEQKIEFFVKELLLGPIGLEFSPLIPKETILKTIILREKVLYLDFSSQIVFSETDLSLTLEEILEGIEKNIYFNYPWIIDIVITVKGQVPFGKKIMEQTGNE